MDPGKPRTRTTAPPTTAPMVGAFGVGAVGASGDGADDVCTPLAGGAAQALAAALEAALASLPGMVGQAR